MPVAFTAAAGATFGSFFEPFTTFLNSWPARNAGTEVFLTRTFSPVAGLRAVRAARSRFSNTPKPVRATFSPFCTVR